MSYWTMQRGRRVLMSGERPVFVPDGEITKLSKSGLEDAWLKLEKRLRRGARTLSSSYVREIRRLQRLIEERLR